MKIKIVVGLGNPGKEYENTRHNIGYKVLDLVSKKLGNSKWKSRDGGLFFDTYIDMYKVIFLKPQQFINLSGDVLIKYVNFYNIDKDDILIINDDLDLPLGNIKIKEKGSSGGHNGLKNIESVLKTKNYKRIKIGIANNKNIDTKDYVLGKFSKDDQKIIDLGIEKAADAVLDYFNISFSELMNKYNKKIKN